MFRRFGFRLTAAAKAKRTIRVGDSDSASCTFTTEKIKTFAEIVGDNNPIHLSEAAATAAGFERVVAHGTLSIGVISNVLGTKLPGPQTVYLQQKTEFVAPVFAGDTVTATVTVKEFNAAKGLVWLDTTVTKSSSSFTAKKSENSNDQSHHAAAVDVNTDKPIVVIKGYALAMNKTVAFEGESAWTFKR